MTLAEVKLAGLRVLVVEDSFLVAASISGLLTDLGCRVVGPYATSDDALRAIGSGGCDLGLLDVNLSSGTSEPVAESLELRGLPFFFVTSYQSPLSIQPRFAACPTVHKPLTRELLRDALVASLRSRP